MVSRSINEHVGEHRGHGHVLPVDGADKPSPLRELGLSLDHNGDVCLYVSFSSSTVGRRRLRLVKTSPMLVEAAFTSPQRDPSGIADRCSATLAEDRALRLGELPPLLPLQLLHRLVCLVVPLVGQALVSLPPPL